MTSDNAGHEVVLPPIYVGRPNLGDRQAFLDRVNAMLDSRWLSNDGPLVREFEERIASVVGVEHCVTMCNATVALEIASKALDFSGEVIVPSYTFIATAHSLQWQGIKPVFADICADSHNIDPESIEKLITPRTRGLVGVHLWGRACDTAAIEELAARHGLPVMYDAAHAFGCSHLGRMIGGFGNCEIFSFHATKFLNSFEGGAVVTNDGALADKIRLMRNFGFSNYDQVDYLGTNGKMTEVCAAMGLTSLEAYESLIATNFDNYQTYRRSLDGLSGIKLIDYNVNERNNYQYIVIEVDTQAAGINRDSIVAALHRENIIARKYFWPGCHRMEPYLSSQPDAFKSLGVTEDVAARVVVLPTGQAVDKAAVNRVCDVIRKALC